MQKYVRKRNTHGGKYKLSLSKIVSFRWDQHVMKMLFTACVCITMLIHTLPSDICAQNQYRKDSIITFAIEAKLLADEMASRHLINVQTKDGIVTLSGSADNPLDCERAIKIGESMRDVQSVINNISVARIVRSDNQIIFGREKKSALIPAMDSQKIDMRFKRRIITPQKKNEIKINYREQSPGLGIIDSRLIMDRYLHNRSINTKDERIIMNGMEGDVAKRFRISYGAFITGVLTEDFTVPEVKRETTGILHGDEFKNKSDEEMKRSVRDAIFHDPRVVSTNIKIEVNKGVITLTGVVDNPEAKNAAEEDAKNTDGVSMVRNYLKVRPGILPRYSTVAERVRDILLRNPLTSHLYIDTEVQNGKVYLYGTVNTFFEKQHAGELASQVPDVTRVINKLNINYRWSPKNDKEIKEKVETELTFSVFVHSPEVSVNVKNGVVYLTGTVHTQQEALAAIEDAYDGGARTVRNFLKVSGEADEELKQLRTKDPLYIEMDYPDYFEDFYFKPYYYYLYP